MEEFSWIPLLGSILMFTPCCKFPRFTSSKQNSAITVPSTAVSVTWILETSFMKGQLSSCRTSSTMSCSKAESSWTPPWRPELLLFNTGGDDSGKKDNPTPHQIKIKAWQVTKKKKKLKHHYSGVLKLWLKSTRHVVRPEVLTILQSCHLLLKCLSCHTKC